MSPLNVFFDNAQRAASAEAAGGTRHSKSVTRTAPSPVAMIGGCGCRRVPGGASRASGSAHHTINRRPSGQSANAPGYGRVTARTRLKIRRVVHDPIDPTVLRRASTEARRQRLILRAPRRRPANQVVELPIEHPHRRLRHLRHDLPRRLARPDGHRLLIHDVTGVRSPGHMVQGRAGLRLAMQHGPIHRGPAAILGQQRAVQIHGTQPGRAKEARRNQVAVIQRTNQVRPKPIADQRLPFRSRKGGRREDGHSGLRGQRRDGPKPPRLAWGRPGG